MLRGVPVLAADRGALPEMFPAGRECGAIFDPDDPAALRGWIERLVAAPERIDAWRARLPPVLSMDAHAAAVAAVYTEVLERRRRS